MKSFIRAHRSSNSVDNYSQPSIDSSIRENANDNGSKTSLSRMNSQFDNPLSIISSSNSMESGTLDVLGSPKRPIVQEFNTPPASIHNIHHSSPTKHSPTIESLQKLANRTQKLFKRASNSNLRSNIEATGGSNYAGSFEHSNKYMSSSSSLPTLDKYNDLDGIPSIKGTITHSWGTKNKRRSVDGMINNISTTNIYDSRIEKQVIHLNSNTNESGFHKGASSYNDLKPAVKLSMKPDLLIKQHPGEYNDENILDSMSQRTASNKPQQQLESLNMPKVRTRRSSNLQKAKNRQARIHSNEDILNLQVNSENEDGVNIKSKIDEAKKVIVIPSITIQEPTKPEITPIPEDINADKSDSESVSSEFSFEYSRLNGRTSSVKYYSKPEDEENTVDDDQVYIDDIYDDEDFDEDMNYDENYDFHSNNSISKEIQSPALDDNLHDDDKPKPQDDSVNQYMNLCDTYTDLKEEEEKEPSVSEFSFSDTIGRDNVIDQEEENRPAKLSNYNDLFDITDDDDDDDGVNDDFANGSDDDAYELGSDDDDYELGCEDVLPSNGKNNDGHNFTKDIIPGCNLQPKSEEEIAVQNNTTSSKVNRFTEENSSLNKKNIGDSAGDQKKTSGQVQSYNDFFDLSDDDDDDDEYDAAQYERSEDKIIRNKINQDTIGSTNFSGQNKYSQNINNSTSNIYHKTSTQQDSVSRPVMDNKNVSKYSDLFDLSDDDDDDDKDGRFGNDANYDDESEVPTQNNSPSNSIPEEYRDRNIARFKNSQPAKKSLLSITTNINSKLTNTKPVKKPYIRSYKLFPIISDDFNDDDDTENESLTPLTSYLDVASPLNSRHFTPIKNGMLSPTNTTRNSTHPISQVLSSQPLPPTARSNILKYHDISSNFDAEVPGLTSNLFFIDEAEEDIYNDNKKEYTSIDDAYNYDLDEINTVPEDFEFSEADIERSKSRNLRNGFGSPLSFRRTHSYHGKPIGVSRENTPVNNRLEINNKTVTFFNQPYSNNISNSLDIVNVGNMESITPPPRSPLTSPLKVSDDNLNFFSKPSPEYKSNSQYSLSPIQESTSTTSSPDRK